MISIKNQVGAKSENNCENYWKNKLSGELSRSSFHYDYKETVSNVRIVDSLGFRFSSEFCLRLLNLCSDSNIKLFEVLASGLTALLHKHSYLGSKDITIGAPVYKEKDSIYSNTILPLRTQIYDGMTFSELLKTVEQTVSEANENREFPIEELPNRLNMHVFGDDFPLFDVALSLENVQDKRYLRHININMIFSFFNTGKYIEGVIEYNSSLYEKATITKIIGHFTTLMSEALTNPSIRISDLDILSEEEKRYLLFELNDTIANYPTEKTIPELFEDQVAKNYNKLAIVFEDKKMTYDELNKRANQLGRSLKEKGVTPDSVVPIFLERSIELLIAIFGILKSGAAYLPIVVDTPAERVQSVLKDSEARFLVSNPYYQNRIVFDGYVVDIEDEKIFHSLNQNLEIINTPDNLIYVIYTSGSTGKPKGVMLEQRNFINLLHYEYRETVIDFSGRVLQFASIGFDVSAQEIFSTLLGGGTIFLTATEMKHDAPRLLEYITRNGVEIVFMPPAYLKFVFSDIGMAENFPLSVKHIIAAGEQLIVPALLKKYLIEKKVFLHNHYGPTESHVITSLTLDPEGEILEAPSIGKSLTNNRIMILGRDNFNLQPLGIPGELYISGVNVARGYSNRPELTDDRFMVNPYIKEERMYRTGDLARWLPDGNIDYMGRIDFQIKIRGFRIEIGEIETQILTQQDQVVKEVSVIPKEDNTGEKYLCAYIVSEIKIDMVRLSNVLSKNLPDYMIPAYFMQIEKIPLNVNGKVDRKALPDPRTAERLEDYIAPRNEIEEKLVEIWSEVLHMKKSAISMDDDFFRLGGHSLKAAVLVVSIHKLLNIKLVMHDIFDMTTIEKLAVYIKDAKEEIYSPIPKAPSKDFYPQTSSQKRLYFITQMEKNNTAYNMQMMDVYCKGIEKENLEIAFKKLIKRHESLRTSFHTIEGEAVQKIHSYEEACKNFKIEYWETSEDGMIYSEEPGQEWTRVTGLPFKDLLDHFVRPFDLSNAPIIRVGLVKIWGHTQLLMIDMHHIMSDGVSEVILIKDLWALYDGEELPELNVQYKDFAVWLNGDDQQKEIEKREPFWLNEFKGEIPILNMPYDFPRPAKLSSDGDFVHFELSKEVTRKINITAQEYGVTTYMILFTAYNVLLAKLSGQEEIVVGTVTAGRGHADLQDIIGMFVDTLVIRSFPESNKTFGDFLKEIKKKTLTAFENQDYPFERLVSKIAQRKDTSRNPLFDVVFSWENEAERTEEYLLEVLMLDKSSPYSFNVKKTKFDMVLVGIEGAEELGFNLEYSTQLFKQETIERFVLYFKKIVNSALKDINIKISEIEIMPDLERGILLYIFNDTESEYTKDKTIHELFESQVIVTPNNIAVSGINYENWIQHLTYKDLNSKANQLARLLRLKGLQPENIVAILINPCQEMIIGLLAILKAGGAFLPIKDGTPPERVRYILEESGTQFLLTRKELVEGITFKGEIIELDDNKIYRDDDKNLSIVNIPQNLAYIIYTSGSTGKPKGVMIEHCALANLCFWHNKYYSVTSLDHATKYAGFGFDASVWEIFPYLIIGASLYIVSEDIKLDIKLLHQYFKDNAITISFLPTQVCEQFMTLEESSLRVLLTGGDKLKTFIKKNYQLYNNYGPTENTVVSTSYPVTELASNIPIGKPLFNNQIYVVDKNLKLQPIGVPGELCIGGDSLARGYLNNTKLTEEKFIENPFKFTDLWSQSSKIYRTGDLARWLTDGNIEFLGRIDYQVKIRGFRIELGEIENQLLHIEGILESVVIAKDDSSGQKYLCAYIVHGQREKIDISSIKMELRKTLPDYMIPTFFVQIERMPLTPNGKIDTKALPDPELKGIEYIAPRNEIEKILAGIWSEIGNIEKVGIDDNFFDIGGDSIKTILISGRLQKRGLIVDVNHFFLYPTIRQLAAHVRMGGEKIDHMSIIRDQKLLNQNIQKDYDQYLAKIDEEKWDDISVKSDFRSILLTGATGYLGSYLVSELLSNTNAKLYLPVRASTVHEAEDRIKKKLSLYFGNDFFDRNIDRIVVLKADLREENLGIETSKYKELCNTIDLVLHSAALVKHYGLYEEFYYNNVKVTEKLLEFALCEKKKEFHFISTMDTGRGDIPGKEYLLFTEYCLDEGQNSDNVYIKSKFEAEKKVLTYRANGLNTSIYRASNMTFNSETGQFQENIHDNFFYSMLKAFIKVGFWSEDMLNVKFDLSFINDAAKSIVLLLTSKGMKNGIYHICNPDVLSWRDMASLLKKSGVELPILDPLVIKANLSKFDGNHEYEKIIERVNIYAWDWTDSGGTLTIPRIDRTVIALKKIGFEWPKLTKMHIDKMILHCKEVGFI